MKKLVLLTSVTAVLLLSAVGCKQNEKEPGTTPDPVLKVNTTIVQATAEGGVYEISYTVENPVDGAVLELTSDADWVSGPDYSAENVVSVTVAPNNDNADRNANLLLTYTYGEGKVLDGEIILHQVYQYDYNTAAQFVEGGFFSGRTVNQPRYAVYISDLGTDEGGTFLPGCSVYRLDLYSDVVPSDYSDIQLPEGTYTEGNIDLYNSFWGKVNAAGDAWEATGNFTNCTVNVSRDGENTVIEGVFTDKEGKVHHLSYSGIVKLDLYSSEGLGLVTFDTEIENPFLSSIKYVEDNGEVMAISMQISGEWEDSSEPMTTIYIDLYAPYDEYKLLPGTYTVGESTDAYTVCPGYVDPSTLTALGTNARYIENGGALLALISDGTIEVTENEGIYTVEMDLYTEQGFKVFGTYVGELKIDNIPGNSFSTLEGDYTVKMDEINYTFGSFYGDKFGTGGGYYEWEMKGPFEQDPESVLTQGTGEEVHFALITNSLEFEDEILSGTYTVAKDPESPQPGEFLPGTRSVTGMNTLSGTYYVGGYEGGYVNIAAPAVDGELNVTNHGDGTYTIEFEFLDDRGNTWDGNWTGELGFMDWTWLAPEQKTSFAEHRMAPSDSGADRKYAAESDCNIIMFGKSDFCR